MYMKKKLQSSKNNKKINNKSVPVFPIDNPMFCTQCDSALDTFWMSDMANNTDAVISNHENCKKIGKFKGEMCSRLYIVSNDDIELFVKD